MGGGQPGVALAQQDDRGEPAFLGEHAVEFLVRVSCDAPEGDRERRAEDDDGEPRNDDDDRGHHHMPLFHGLPRERSHNVRTAVQALAQVKSL